MIYELNENYFVRNFIEHDLEGAYRQWFEDQEVCTYNSHGKFFPRFKDLKAYFESTKGDELLVWAICHKEDGHIGNISLQNISFIDRRAELAILLGEKKHWNKGVSFLAVRSLMEHGFNKLNLEKIHCGTAENNHGMLALAKKSGMKEEGRRIKHLWLDGLWVDVIELAILRDEWIARKA